MTVVPVTVVRVTLVSVTAGTVVRGFALPRFGLVVLVRHGFSVAVFGGGTRDADRLVPSACKTAADGDRARWMTRASDAAGDEAYGGRVFLHHYGVHLAGPDLDRATAGYPGDRLAARGFNGDVGRHARSWRHRLATSDPAALGSRAARKTLFAVAGLVSVHDSTWTTDRMSARRRWQQLHPELAPGLAELSGWASDRTVADRDALARLPTRSSTRSCGSSPT